MVLKLPDSYIRIHGQIRVSDEKAAVLQKTFLKHSQWLTEFSEGLDTFS